MVVFAGGKTAAGVGTTPYPPRSSSSTLSPLAPPFTLNPKANRLDPLGGPNSDCTFPLPHEGFRAYGNDSYLWQGKQANSSTSKLHYESECTDWLHTEIQEFVTDSHPCTISEGSKFPTSGNRLVPHIQISEPVSVKETSNIFGPHTTYKLSNDMAQYNSSESSARAPSSLHKGMPYAHSIPLESSKTVDSNPSYDKYMMQLDSCTTMASYFPAKTCSTSFQPAASGTSSYMQQDKSHTFENPYSINADNVDHIPLKDNRIIQNLDVKEGCYAVSGTNNVNKYSGVSTCCFSSGLESTNIKSTVHSMEANFGLQNNHADLPNAFVSDCGLAESVHSPSYGSSGTHDQTVDSPCWKGASVSQQSSFSHFEPEMLHSAECGSKLCSDFDKCQKHLPFTTGYSGCSSPSEQLRRMIYNEKMGSSRHNLIESSSVLSTTKHKCTDIAKTHLDCLKEIQPLGICKEQNAEVRSDKEREPVGKDNEMVLSSQESIISSNQHLLTADIANPENSFKCAVQGRSSECQPPASDLAALSDTIEPLGSSLVMFKDASLNVFLGKLQYLSEMLLSSDYFDASELKDRDHEVLQSVIDNLETFAIKNKKGFSKGRFRNSEPIVAQSSGLMGNEGSQRNIKLFHEVKENVHSVASGMNNNDLDSLGFNYGASYINKDHDVTENLQTIQEKKYCEQEEKLQSVVYKKLWVDAEAALCSMKYELQLAQMKAESLNHNYQTEGNNPQSPQIFLHSINNTVLKTNPGKTLTGITAVKEELDPSAVARINALNVRHSRPSFDEEGIDRSVMARLDILKGRNEWSGSTTAEHQQKMTMQTDYYVDPRTVCGRRFQSHASNYQGKKMLYGGQGKSNSTSS